MILTNCYSATYNRTVVIYKDQSSDAFGYGLGPDSSRKVPPTKEQPATFVLWKKPELQSLLKFRFNPSLKPDGTPYIIKLGKEKIIVELHSDILPVEFINQYHPYDWNFSISTPGGGFLQRTDNYATEAPTTGYEDFINIDIKKTDNKWNERYEGDYFIHFFDNTYGRINFYICPEGGSGSFIKGKALLNPLPQSVNLDTDTVSPDEY